MLRDLLESDEFKKVDHGSHLRQVVTFQVKWWYQILQRCRICLSQELPDPVNLSVSIRSL